MTRTFRRNSVTDSGGMYASNNLRTIDDDQSARRDRRLYELDKDFQYQLKHLKGVVRESRSVFKSYNKPHSNSKS